MFRILSIGCILLFLTESLAFAQSDPFAEAQQFENIAAYYSARTQYRAALKSDAHDQEKVLLHLARLEYQTGYTEKAITYWKRIHKKQSGSPYFICATLNLAGENARQSRRAENKREKLDEEFDQKAREQFKNAVEAYQNLVENGSYQGFEYWEFLNAFYFIKKPEKLMSRLSMAVSRAQDRNLEKDFVSLAWYNYDLESKVRRKTILSLKPGLMGLPSTQYDNSQKVLNLVNQEKASYEALMSHPLVLKTPDLQFRMKARYIRLAEAVGDYCMDWSNRLINNDVDSVRTVATQLMHYAQEVDQSVLLSLQDLVEPGSHIYKNPSKFSDLEKLKVTRKAMILKIAYMEKMMEILYPATWDWHNHAKLLAINLSNPDNPSKDFKAQFVQHTYNSALSIQALNDYVTANLPTKKDQFQYSSVTYEEKILAIDVAMSLFDHTNTYPDGVLFGFGGTRIKSFVKENPIYDAFYHSENAKSAIMMKDLISKEQEDQNLDHIAGVHELQEALDDSTALIIFQITPGGFYQFTITKEELKLRKRNKNDDDLRPHIKAVRNGILYKEDKIYLESAYYLYKKLFPNKFKENIKKLVIIPDEQLAAIPFEALVRSKVKKKEIGNSRSYPFLIKRYEVSYSFSASLWNYKKTDPPENPELVGFAPVFEDNTTGSKLSDEEVKAVRAVQLEEDERGILRGTSIVPLPGTERELNGISELFQGMNLEAQTHKHQEATEDAFKQQEFHPNEILHIASHGFVNTANPEKSGIMFYQSERDDDILYMNEIIAMDINVFMATLSACETNLGQVVKGEGVIGLSRAFMLAGCSNVIASLWRVNDASTAQLMLTFYENMISKGMTPSMALQQSKKKLIKSGEFSHPYYWSPFLLVGH